MPKELNTQRAAEEQEEAGRGPVSLENLKIERKRKGARNTVFTIEMDVVALEESEMGRERDRILLQRIQALESEKSRMTAKIQEMMDERDRARTDLQQAQVRGDKLHCTL